MKAGREKSGADPRLICPRPEGKHTWARRRATISRLPFALRRHWKIVTFNERWANSKLVSPKRNQRDTVFPTVRARKSAIRFARFSIRYRGIIKHAGCSLFTVCIFHVTRCRYIVFSFILQPLTKVFTHSNIYRSISYWCRVKHFEISLTFQRDSTVVIVQCLSSKQFWKYVNIEITYNANFYYCH